MLERRPSKWRSIAATAWRIAHQLKTGARRPSEISQSTGLWIESQRQALSSCRFAWKPKRTPGSATREAVPRPHPRHLCNRVSGSPQGICPIPDVVCRSWCAKPPALWPHHGRECVYHEARRSGVLFSLPSQQPPAADHFGSASAGSLHCEPPRLVRRQRRVARHRLIAPVS